MHPIAVHIGNYPIRYAGLLYVVAAIGMWLYARRIARRRNWDITLVLPGVALVVAAAYVGARLYHAAGIGLPAGNLPVAMVTPGELSFFGGLALGSVVLLVYLRWAGLPVGAVADELALAAPFVYATFRLGCLLNGDDYGRTTALPWGLTFPLGSPPAFDPVHPVQLYEILAMAPIALVLWHRHGKNLPDGALSFELCVLLGAERLLADSLRANPGSTLLLSQWLALILAAVGVAGRIYITRDARSGIA